MNCPKCHSAVAANWSFCPHCQTELNPVELTPVESPLVEPPPVASPPVASPVESPLVQPNPYQMPTAKGYQTNATHEGDATGGLIPYKNPKALLAYYLGIFSGLPLIGFPVGIAAFVLGIMGLRDRKRNPVIKGSVHAGIGIGCGGFFALLWGFAIVSIIIALIVGPN